MEDMAPLPTSRKVPRPRDVANGSRRPWAALLLRPGASNHGRGLAQQPKAGAQLGAGPSKGKDETMTTKAKITKAAKPAKGGTPTKADIAFRMLTAKAGTTRACDRAGLRRLGDRRETVLRAQESETAQGARWHVVRDTAQGRLICRGSTHPRGPAMLRAFCVGDVRGRDPPPRGPPQDAARRAQGGYWCVFVGRPLGWAGAARGPRNTYTTDTSNGLPVCASKV
jgi:hypothetical protein